MLINLQELRGYSVRPDPQALTESVRPAAQGDAAAQAAVCGAMLWASFAAPGAITQVFDLISRSQLSLHADPAAILAHSAAPPEEFWQQFEATLTGPEEGYDATSITLAVASSTMSTRRSANLQLWRIWVRKMRQTNLYRQ